MSVSHNQTEKTNIGFLGITFTATYSDLLRFMKGETSDPFPADEGLCPCTLENDELTYYNRFLKWGSGHGLVIHKDPKARGIILKSLEKDIKGSYFWTKNSQYMVHHHLFSYQ